MEVFVFQRRLKYGSELKKLEDFSIFSAAVSVWADHSLQSSDVRPKFKCVF